MEKSRKRALEDIDRKLVTPSSKKRRQHRPSDTDSPAQATTTSNPSIATSSPTLIGSPAPITPSPIVRPSTPSYTSSTSSSETSESASSTSSEETDSASSSSADSSIQQPRSRLPSLLPHITSPSTTSSGTSTDSGSYTSASVSDDITDDLSSSSSDDSSEDDDEDEDDESVSTSSGSSASASSSSSSALSSFSSTHTSQPPPNISIASLTADNLSHLQARLNALLPEIKSANEVLETERKEGRLGRRDIENVGDGEREGGYVEMDLGLGVLEEKKEGGNEGYEGDGNESERSRVEEVGERVEREDVLGKMMGRKRSWGKGKGKVGIEEVRS